jgi:hypothetical protein
MNYPPKYEASIHELSGNFHHKEELKVNSPYSLHTESSAMPIIFCSKIVNEFEHIKEAQKGNIPQLWHDKKWANEFFMFIEWLIGKNKPPEVLEIHPPFSDYCRSFDQFLGIFNTFYKKFKSKYPATTIVIENRFGTRYKGGKFLLSTCSDVLEFCKVLRNPNNSDINLKIVIDYPQIFSAETGNGKKAENWMGPDPLKLVEKIISFNQELKKYRKIIKGFHMWGKLKTGNKWRSHAGNFDTFFSNDNELKHMFLESVFTTFNDNMVRYFVPEVNSGESDLHSIVTDMEKEGFIFKSHIIKTKAYLKLEAFQQAFNDYFRPWGIQLPGHELVLRSCGVIKEADWLIQFRFGKEEENKEYMDVYCIHRMTIDKHFRIYEDGTSEDLPAFSEFLTSYNPDDLENKRKAEEEDKKKINEIKKILIEKGFYPFPYVNDLVSNIDLYIKSNM